MADQLDQALSHAVGEAVTLEGQVGGGCISEAVRGRTASGRRVFVKHNRGAASAMFREEARGLRALAAAEGCRVPEVLGVADGDGGRPGLLVLEWIEPGRPGRGYADELGQGLARQHRTQAERYGFDADNFIGSTPQPNPWRESWIKLFRDDRLGFQQRLLNERGRAIPALNRRLDTVRERLDEWLELPDELPALLHGDLWGGNAMADERGEPVLIDPAVYYGCREADLAMTELFGGFPSRFLDAYDEAFPLAPGYPERRDLYNLYHVLNHANLFGGGYASQADRICRRYVG